MKLFDPIPTDIDELLKNVLNGRTGLPDLQRPFVWKDSKVRDLLDSMLKGYPIGYVMLWASPNDYDQSSQIGHNNKMYDRPDDLVIDGQQRLTALLAALYGLKVKDSKFKERNIRISFHPLKKEFAVWSQAYEKDPEWINAVSEVYTCDSVSRFRKGYITSLNDYRQKKELPLLTDDEEETIEASFDEIIALKTYQLPTLKIRNEASEEDVADIFVRVNSGGQKLGDDNFIETLLAVYDNEVHDTIKRYCEQSRIPATGTSYNNIIELDPMHMIRMTVGYGFRRARLRYAYMLLRGKDLETRETSEETRNANLKIFRDALDKVTNLNDWHAFLNIFASAGYLSKSIVSSPNAVAFCYVLYLIGKHDYSVPPMKLAYIIRKWIFMVTISSFYTSSTESTVEAQFADLRTITTADGFVAYLEQVISDTLTDDFFNVTLLNALGTSSAQSPAWYGFVASLCILNVNTLFSTIPVSQYFAPGMSGTKSAIDKHHLFPKEYLGRIGIDDDRERNQIANYAILDYQTNINISDNPPADYVQRFRENLGDGFAKTCTDNAVPENYDSMDYNTFLEIRRILMSKKIREAYQRLSILE